MPPSSLAILDSDEKRLEYLKSVFKRDDYKVFSFVDIQPLLEQLAQNPMAAILLEYGTLTHSERNEIVRIFRQYDHNNIFIYNLPDDANRRLAFYELGARRVFDVSSPVEEIYYALKGPLQNFSRSTPGTELVSTGDLQEMPLKNLLSTMGKEERSGVLRLFSNQMAGKIYFKQGYPIHAQVGMHEGEAALMHMLFWPEGTFRFSSKMTFNGRGSVGISHVALLIAAEKIRKQFAVHIGNLGSLRATVRVQYAGDLQQSGLAVDEAFVELIRRPVMIKKILENPVYPNFTTVEKLNLLLENGYLHVYDEEKKKESSAEAISAESSTVVTRPGESFAAEMIRYFDLGEKARPYVIPVLSVHGRNGSRFIQTLFDAGEELYKGQMILDSHRSCLLESLAINEQIIDDVEERKDDLIGFVYVLGEEAYERLDYTRYILGKMSQLYPLPLVILFTGAVQQPESLKKELNIPGSHPVFTVALDKKEQLEEVILKMALYRQEEEEEESGEDAHSEDEVTTDA
ncbi:MAG TPA: DUF4388 domain-containing protein [Caldithrix abyssi]|uniref:DUF4388 domain-containing protein n=1 Tax=Caldithrix abyssi TaxID=187145 RepID=A0A7V1PWP1_CALAY|nr:DUF4388 domain-containing protein [Caldithrix abyssi]